VSDISQFLNNVSGGKYNTGLAPMATNTVAPIVGLNSFLPQSTTAVPTLSSGSLFNGSMLGNPTSVNDAVSQGIGGVTGSHGLLSGWDGTSGTTGIGQGSTTDANQSFYTNKALGDFSAGLNYTPMGMAKAVIKNGIAYNMNNASLLGLANDKNNGYSDPISALDAIQGWSGAGVPLSSQSMASNPMQQDPATSQQRALAAALSDSSNPSAL
jgi:hypothetical protein